jgi:membrane carboxypeptidase/penicillin-binding protein
MRHNLRGVVQQGTATRARRLKPVAAGKTGSLPYDIWFNGFTGAGVTTAWVGADLRERPLGRSLRHSGVYGASHPLSVFMAVTTAAAKGMTAANLLRPVPSSVQFVRVDPESGNRKMKGGVSLPHVRGNVPIYVDRGAGSSDDIHHSESEF